MMPYQLKDPCKLLMNCVLSLMEKTVGHQHLRPYGITLKERSGLLGVKKKLEEKLLECMLEEFQGKVQKMIRIFGITGIFFKNKKFYILQCAELGLVADPVIEAIARLEFEDGLRMGVLPEGCWGPNTVAQRGIQYL